jgi:two-component system chemotaxis response regulator CheB
MSAPAIQAVVIGASAGAVPALLEILPALPAAYRLPVLIVVHVPPDRENALVALFAAKSRIAIKEAEDKEAIEPGVVYFAPSDYHLLVELDGTLSLSADGPINHSRPAIDALFETAADAYGEALAAFVLTGANDDGAAGLAAVCAAGGGAFVEDPAAAYSPIMPAAAVAACPNATVLTLAQIRAHLLTLGAP